MPIEAKLKRVLVDDPSRCQATGGSGQCPFRAAGTRIGDVWEGPKYCLRHGAATGQKSEDKRNFRIYLSSIWKDRIGEQADHPRLRTLREEIGILRITLERILDSCKDDIALIMKAGQISEIVRELGKLQKANQFLDIQNKTLLDKIQAKEFVQELGDIISNYIDDPEILRFVSEDMLSSLEQKFST